MSQQPAQKHSTITNSHTRARHFLKKEKHCPGAKFQKRGKKCEIVRPRLNQLSPWLLPFPKIKLDLDLSLKVKYQEGNMYKSGLSQSNICIFQEKPTQQKNKIRNGYEKAQRSMLKN